MPLHTPTEETNSGCFFGTVGDEEEEEENEKGKSSEKQHASEKKCENERAYVCLYIKSCLSLIDTVSFSSVPVTTGTGG